MSNALAAAINSLTKEQAAEYMQQTDRLLWVEYNILDVYELPKSCADAIEDALEQLAEDAA